MEDNLDECPQCHAEVELDNYEREDAADSNSGKPEVRVHLVCTSCGLRIQNVFVFQVQYTEDRLR